MNDKQIKEKQRLYKALSSINAFDFWDLDKLDSEVANELKKMKKRHWLYIVYPESAPEDWIEQMRLSGVKFAISPLHDKDLDILGNPKKPHWHMIVVFDGPTTFLTAITFNAITNGPYPKMCENLRGAYEYFIHKNDPDKVQYLAEDIQEFNGFTIDISNKDVLRIKKELAELILKEKIVEYAEFDLIVRLSYDMDYYSVASNNTLYFNSLIKSYHHNHEIIQKRIKQLENNIEEKNQKEE